MEQMDSDVLLASLLTFFFATDKKCFPCPCLLRALQAADLVERMDSDVPPTPLAGRGGGGGLSAGGVGSGGAAEEAEVKFELQLYKVRDGEYILDMQVSRGGAARWRGGGGVQTGHAVGRDGRWRGGGWWVGLGSAAEFSG